MSSLAHDLLNTGSYTLSQDHYESLCDIRDKLLLFAQLLGTAATPGDENAVLLIRRALLGQLFADLSCQLKEVVEATHRSPTPSDVWAPH